MFELIFFATRPIKRTYINKQIQCNLLFLSAGRQRKINQSQSASQKHIKVLLWTRVEQWPVSLIFNRYPARNPLFLTDKNYFGQESSSAAVVCMANRCKKRSILCHQNRGLPGQILPLEWLKKNLPVLASLEQRYNFARYVFSCPDQFFLEGGCISHMSGCKCATNCKYE